MARTVFYFGLVALCTGSFRAPAIPLITSDPYFQSFIMGDNSTDGVVRHWDQRPKELVGLVRVDGTTYRFLGDCGHDATPKKPGPVKVHEDTNVAPGECDIVSYGNMDDVTCNELCYGKAACKAFVLGTSKRSRCWLKSCSEPLQPDKGSRGFVLTGEHPPPPPSSCDFPAMEQLSVAVLPTRTVFRLRDPGSRVELNVTFLSTLFTDDYPRLSRPVSYVVMDVRSLSGRHDVDLYLDATAQWVVNAEEEEVDWSFGAERSWVRLGTSEQKVLGTKGDKTNINWGYMYLRGLELTSTWAGAAKSSRAAFVATGALHLEDDMRKPRRCSDELPALALSASLAGVGQAPVRRTALLGYDDIRSVRYYDEGDFSGLWTRTWRTIDAAMDAAAGELDAMLARSEEHDAALMDELAKVGGSAYAQVGALAYRQTLAATKLVWNSQRGEAWNFLKEISTNGDMQTMDVVYPASPMLLYTRPDLLARLLLPVLAFANNETSTPFLNPFSPHEIGLYPIADHNTAQQEPMPMENTGNMFLMLAAIVKADPAHDTSFLVPKYWPLLRSWADYLNASLPYPANQLCTDDFTGRLANNTNLAAKGIVALEAFAGLCEAAGGEDCQLYRHSARAFAKTWKEEAWERDHFKIAYDFPNSYSLKYNMVWQKLLGMDGPFDWEAIAPTEISYYLSKANEYGTPMDSRHTYVKLDWLSWAAAMADDDESFHALQDPIYKMAQDSRSRVPLNDLYDTITAVASRAPLSFVDRPVVGGVFAKMLRARSEARPLVV